MSVAPKFKNLPLMTARTLIGAAAGRVRSSQVKTPAPQPAVALLTPYLRSDGGTLLTPGAVPGAASTFVADPGPPPFGRERNVRTPTVESTATSAQTSVTFVAG